MGITEPFYFAVPNWMPTPDRAAVPRRLADVFGVTGHIEFVRAEPKFRLYRVVN